MNVSIHGDGPKDRRVTTDANAANGKAAVKEPALTNPQLQAAVDKIKAGDTVTAEFYTLPDNKQLNHTVSGTVRGGNAKFPRLLYVGFDSLTRYDGVVSDNLVRIVGHMLNRPLYENAPSVLVPMKYDTVEDKHTTVWTFNGDWWESLVGVAGTDDLREQYAPLKLVGRAVGR